MAIDGDETQSQHHRLLELVREISAVNVNNGGGELVFKKDCMDLIRRASLLTHFLVEVKDFEGQFCNLGDGSSSSASGYWWFDLVTALTEAKSLLLVAGSFQSTSDSEEATEKIAFQFQGVTMKLEQALANIPYDQFEVSEEVQEQVGLARTQLRRATERYESVTGRRISLASSQAISEEMDLVQEMDELPRGVDTSDDICIMETLDCHSHSNGLESESSGIDEVARELKVGHEDEKVNIACTSREDLKKGDVREIPQDFLCPISLELMRDPVIVATGQTYERSFIQRWVDSGNATCPITHEKLEHLTLTPNYVLRSVINQWCVDNNIELLTLANGRIRKSDGSFLDVSGDMEVIRALVQKLSSPSIEERKAAVTEIRSISKRSTDNRILIAEAGAIPLLVTLLISEDASIQENAVTSILNLSIYENNKALIMLADATPSIVHVLKTGSVEARENAAATLFSLSLVDENKIIIGASEAIPVLVELLEHGTGRGKKDAATALFNLCIYHRNKGRAVRAGIVAALLKMLTDATNSMVDEALTIMSILASNQEAKVAMVEANAIPILIDLLQTGLPRNKENATAILLSLCKRDLENICCINSLGAVVPLTDIARNGTERAKRKATSLLEHIRKVQQN